MRKSRPDYIQFFPTLRCNKQCGFCFVKSSGGCKDFPIEAAGRLAEVMDILCIFGFDILGGEPLLYEGLSDLIRAVTNKGINTTLSSNGTCPEGLCRLRASFSPELLTIGISLNKEPVSEALHEFIIEHKPLLKSVALQEIAIPNIALPYISDPGIAYYLLFMDTITPADVSESVPFLKYIKALGEIKKKHRNVYGVYCGGFLPDTVHNPLLAAVRCPAGTTKLSVAPDGSVYPCYLFFGRAEFRLGNLLDDDFGLIWENPMLDYFRAYIGNRCVVTDCQCHDKCHGGCPAVSLLVAGSLDAADPRCNLQL